MLSVVSVVEDQVQVGDSIDVLDHGFVRLDGCMADDLSVVNGARVSFASRVEEMTEREEGLIRFLMRERHGTPFEHNSFRFHVKCPIFVDARMDAPPCRRASTSGRAGTRSSSPSSTCPQPRTCARRSASPARTRSTRSPTSWPRRRARPSAPSTSRPTRPTCSCSSKGVAKEIARNVLPVAIYTQFYWTVNARSLMNFVSLRNAETAQREIRRYAEAVERFFAGAMPVTHAAFVANERRAP